jgi:hypothetical protein
VGIGKVLKVHKTTVWITFPKIRHDKCIYDKAHVRYLEERRMNLDFIHNNFELINITNCLNHWPKTILIDDINKEVIVNHCLYGVYEFPPICSVFKIK